MSDPLDRQAVEKVIAQIADPETGRGLMEMQQLREVEWDGSELRVTVSLTTHSAPLWDETRASIEQQLRAQLTQPKSVVVTIQKHERPPQKLGQIGLTAKSVIAVGSGKGGVGKSTVAVALACGLQRAGCAVGLMDADVYGPSVPHLLGLTGRPEVVDKKIQPVEKDGLRVMSMGFLVPPDEAVVWRGPMLHGAITQFLRDTSWGDLDYLIIDMPPGTGDIALTLSQLLPLTGAVVVCTPQDVALLDAVKAVAMFRKVNIPMLGMVENMSGFLCPDCGKRYDIFGSGGAQQRAAELDVPFLGAVPIQLAIREQGDAGRMEAIYSDPVTADVFAPICHDLVRNLADSSAQQPPQPQLPVL